jgi:purine-binding chemotaxis protein CheW
MGRVALTDDLAGLRRGDSAKPGLRVREALIFELDGQAYGIDVRVVRDVRECERPAPIADAPAFVKGILHVQGATVPLVDLRARLGRRQTESAVGGVAIVLGVIESAVALAVDAVSDIAPLSAELGGEEALVYAGDIDPQLVAGVGRAGSRLLIVLDGEALIRTIGLELRDPRE